MNGTRKSNLFGKITILVVIFCFCLPAQAKYGGGTGEPNNPYLIYTAEQMNQIGLNQGDWGKHFKLMADIYLGYYDGLDGRPKFNCIGKGSPYGHTGFTGSFDGNGKTIRNFTYSTYKSYNVAIFAYLDGPTGKIQDLIIESPLVNYIGHGFCGALVGRAEGGIIRNCHVIGGSILWGSYVGALVGDNWADVYNCSAATSVTGTERVGGLVGRNFGRIYESFASGPVSGTRLVGGMAGINSDAFSSHGMIENSYSTSDVTGQYAGGLVGQQWGGSVVNSYSTGTVSGSSSIGGLIGGIVVGGYASNSFWDTSTSLIEISAGGTGLPTEQMQDIDTFLNAGWDFVGETVNGIEDIWKIYEGEYYPRLSWEKYGGGTGESNNPYLIYTSCQMNAIGAEPKDWDKHFKLMADVDLSGFTGTSFNIIGERYYQSGWVENPFTGVFDGNGHTISNFTYTSAGIKWIGLFGYVSGENAEIRNLGLINPNVDAGTGGRVGSLVGKLSNGTVTNCYVKGGSVAGNRDIGGLVGGNFRGTITNCYSTGSVSGSEYVGGLVGENYHGAITNCYSTGSVTGDEEVGGLVGDNWSFGTISNCYSSGDVSGFKSVGGLVGCNNSTITNSYSIAGVSGTLFVGGLVGINDRTITNCYSTGNVVGDNPYIGGLVGSHYYGTVVGCFWDIETSGQTTSGCGTPKTTDQMKELNTFLYWGVCGNEGFWTIDDGYDYPRLAWQNLPGAPIENYEPVYGGGTGTEADPYQIWTAEQINTIGLILCHWDKHFKLMADIDLAEYTGEEFNIIGEYVGYNDPDNKPFTGVFDGNNHTITNFTYSSPHTDYIGLFGFIYGEVRNLGLERVSVSGGLGIIGGLVGRNDHGRVSKCYSTGFVSGYDQVGGLVGSSIGSVLNCYSTCDVNGLGNFIGGLVGYNADSISNCYSTGNVSGDYFEVGGLVGRNGYYGSISNCYSNGDVSGDDDVGGLVGYNYGSVSNCFWDTDTQTHDVTESIGYNRGTITNVVGLSTAEMKTKSTFTEAGWDFVGETFNGIEDIWFIPQQDYPHLWWEGMQVLMKMTPRTLNCRSEGNWVKAHLTLPQGFTVEDVDSNRPAVLHSFGFESAPLYVFVNENELVEIEAAFEREAVCSLAGDWPEALTVAGFLADGNIFLGTSTVRIIHPGMKVIEELASCWLQGDCVHPTWCDGIDMNRDSLVNLLDYALLMNVNVEFVTDE